MLCSKNFLVEFIFQPSPCPASPEFQPWACTSTLVYLCVHLLLWIPGARGPFPFCASGGGPGRLTLSPPPSGRQHGLLLPSPPTLFFAATWLSLPFIFLPSLQSLVFLGESYSSTFLVPASTQNQQHTVWPGGLCIEDPFHQRWSLVISATVLIH